MGHFNDAQYRGPGMKIGGGESEVKGSGVDRVGVADVKTKGDTKDERKSDYRGPAGKLTTE